MMMTVLCLNAGAHVPFSFFFSYNFTGRFLEHLGLFFFNSIVLFFCLLFFDWVLYMVMGLFSYGIM